MQRKKKEPLCFIYMCADRNTCSKKKKEEKAPKWVTTQHTAKKSKKENCTPNKIIQKVH